MNAVDMKQLFLLEDAEWSLYTDEKCLCLLDRWHYRMQTIRRQHPKGSLVPKEVRAEIKYILDSMNDMDRELQDRHCRMS
jgi:hypothetical protein